MSPSFVSRQPPILLGLLRIALASIVLVSPEPEIARLVAARPSVSWVRPEGLGWLGTLVPLTPTAIAIAHRVLQTSGVLVLVGIWTRPLLGVLAACMLYVFGAAQLTGTVTHDMHLLWLAVLLAMTPRPFGEPLSLEAWAHGSIAGGPATPESTFSVLAARLWLGFVYFFPGVHKLAGPEGLGWISAESLRGQMYFKWFEAGAVPWPRIDRVPWLLDIAAGAVVAFELAMPALVLFRRTRPVALVAGLTFHAAAGHFLDIHFPSLMVCYVVLLPGDRLRTLALRVLSSCKSCKESTLASLRDLGSGVPVDSARTRRWRIAPLAASFAVITLAIVSAGVRGQTQAYPFACYPTFATRAPDEIVDLAVDVRGENGVHTFRLPLRRRQDEWGMVWRIAGLYGDPIDRGRLEAFARTIVPPSYNGKRRWMLEAYDVRPERYGDEPLRRWPILEE
ncbi:MAG TPA: HTTM domain-containing protein [Labilithrix sp.]|nr:HTTM domain-containing protein [Labilithrix sp.]